MKKVIDIDGMSCKHCARAVEQALGGLPGVKARVDLKKNQAEVNAAGEVSDDALRQAVTEAGYEVTGIR